MRIFIEIVLIIAAFCFGVYSEYWAQWKLTGMKYQKIIDKVNNREVVVNE
jgi:hypothetical protein